MNHFDRSFPSPSPFRRLVLAAWTCAALALAPFPNGILGQGLAPAAETASATQADWPQWGGSSARNSVATTAADLPIEWNVGDFDRKTGRWLNKNAKHIVWAARLGSESYGSPVVVGDRVFCATNNGAGYLSRRPASHDLGCLLCFDRQQGSFLWQFSAEKLAAGRNVDWPKQGICSTPVVEGDRLWIVSNRGEVVCLDARRKGGPPHAAPSQPGSSSGTGEATTLWSFDMMRQLGTVQRYMASCSPTLAGDLLLVNTSNGCDPSGKMPAPKAPSFIALDKRSGKLVWADNSPGSNVLDGQWGSPAFGVLGGVPQAIFPGGDGWLYSFEARPTDHGKPKLLWKFDCNAKESRWEVGGTGNRNTLISTPVIHNGRVYIATGQDPESGEGAGDLWCIDPTRRGDASAQLVVDRQDKPVAPRRVCAVDKAAGERVVANPRSAVVWHYGGTTESSGGNAPGGDSNGDDQAKKMHRSLGMPVIQGNLLVIGDFAGIVHCLDAKTGKSLWTHDMMAAIWGSPLVADGRVYLGNQDGDVTVFALDRTLKVLAKNAMGSPVYGTPTACGDVLYVGTSTYVFAIRKAK
jgi:outer membrane protein assembly factor BamB